MVHADVEHVHNKFTFEFLSPNSAAIEIDSDCFTTVDRLLANTVNRSGPRIDPWGTPFPMLLQTDFLPQATTLCMLTKPYQFFPSYTVAIQLC